MNWAELFLGLAVLVGFGVLKILAELVWEGLKHRLRRELRNDPVPVPRASAGGAESAPPTPREGDETAFAGHGRTGGGP